MLVLFSIKKLNILNRTTVTKYSYEILLKPADELPEDVNPELREVRTKFVFYEHSHRLTLTSEVFFLLLIYSFCVGKSVDHCFLFRSISYRDFNSM